MTTQTPKTVDATAIPAFQVGDVVADLNDPKRAFCVVEKICDDDVLDALTRPTPSAPEPNEYSTFRPPTRAEDNLVIDARGLVTCKASSADVAKIIAATLNHALLSAPEPESGEQPVAWRDACQDALAGWRYIREHHGDLYGVGWDRVEQKLEKVLSRSASSAPAATSEKRGRTCYARDEELCDDPACYHTCKMDSASPQPEAGAGVTEEQIARQIMRFIGEEICTDDLAQIAARAILARIAQVGQSEAEYTRLHDVAWAAQALLNADDIVHSTLSRSEAVREADKHLRQKLGIWQMHHTAKTNPDSEKRDA